MRYAGAIHYVLEEGCVSGHLFLPFKEVEEKTHELLNRDCEQEVVSTAEVTRAVHRENQDGRVYVEAERVYLPFERHCEVTVAKRVVSLLLSEPLPRTYRMDKEIQYTEQKLNQTLAPSQRNAVELCLNQQVAIMTGARCWKNYYA
jgi:exodeoxyribonuclease V alpha subunit